MRYNAAILDDRRRRRAGFLSGQTGLSKKRPLFQNGDNGLLALLRHHGQLDLARVNIEHRLGYLPLRKQRLSLQELEARFTFADLGEKQLGVKERRS